MNHDPFGVLNVTPEPADIWEQGCFDEFEPQRVKLSLDFSDGKIYAALWYRGEEVDSFAEVGNPEDLFDWVETARDALLSLQIRLEGNGVHD